MQARTPRSAAHFVHSAAAERCHSVAVLAKALEKGYEQAATGRVLHQGGCGVGSRRQPGLADRQLHSPRPLDGWMEHAIGQPSLDH